MLGGNFLFLFFISLNFYEKHNLSNLTELNQIQNLRIAFNASENGLSFEAMSKAGYDEILNILKRR